MLLLAPFGYNSNLSSLGSGFALGEKGEKKTAWAKKKKFGERSESIVNIFPLTPFFGLSRKLYERLTGLVYKTIDSPNSNKTNNEPQL